MVLFDNITGKPIAALARNTSDKWFEDRPDPRYCGGNSVFHLSRFGARRVVRAISLVSERVDWTKILKIKYTSCASRGGMTFVEFPTRMNLSSSSSLTTTTAPVASEHTFATYRACFMVYFSVVNLCSMFKLLHGRFMLRFRGVIPRINYKRWRSRSIFLHANCFGSRTPDVLQTQRTTWKVIKGYLPRRIKVDNKAFNTSYHRHSNALKEMSSQVKRSEVLGTMYKSWKESYNIYTEKGD